MCSSDLKEKKGGANCQSRNRQVRTLTIARCAVQRAMQTTAQKKGAAGGRNSKRGGAARQVPGQAPTRERVSRKRGRGELGPSSRRPVSNWPAAGKG